MKKVLLSVLAIISVMLLPATVFASPVHPSKTVITGHVKYQNNGRAVKNASVSVTCNGNTLHTTSNNWGAYSVTFNSPKSCPIGSTVTVIATTKDGESGTSEGKVYSDSCNYDVGVVNVKVALPEMGALTGSVAALTAGGAFFVIRRRSYVGSRWISTVRNRYLS